MPTSMPTGTDRASQPKYGTAASATWAKLFTSPIRARTVTKTATTAKVTCSPGVSGRGASAEATAPITWSGGFLVTSTGASVR